MTIVKMTPHPVCIQDASAHVHLHITITYFLAFLVQVISSYPILISNKIVRLFPSNHYVFATKVSGYFHVTVVYFPQ